MTSLADISLSLGEELEKASRESKARAVAVALLDFESGFRFSIAGDRWFHAASTIKRTPAMINLLEPRYCQLRSCRDRAEPDLTDW